MFSALKTIESLKNLYGFLVASAIAWLLSLIAKALYLWVITTAAVMIIVIAILFIRNYIRVLKNKY